MTHIQKILFDLSDKKYAAFQARLNPTVTPDKIIGVRVPDLRRLAAGLYGTDECNAFLGTLPHNYFDENMLHAILLIKEKNFDTAISRVEEFLPYIDNWAVCDTVLPKAFQKDRNLLSEHIHCWIASDKEFTCRFGIKMLINLFLEDDFKVEYLQTVADIRRDEYYVKMIVAWYFATALTKQWEAAIPFIEQHRLADWEHKKSIQKACESFRISDERKEYLRNLK